MLPREPDAAVRAHARAQHLDVPIAVLQAALEVAVRPVPCVGVVLPLRRDEGEGFAAGGVVPRQAGVERVQEVVEVGVVLWGGLGDALEVGDEVGGAGPVGVEEKGGLRAVGRESGERDALLVPDDVLRVVGVGWVEELDEGGRFVGVGVVLQRWSVRVAGGGGVVFVSVPEGLGEGDVYFLQTAVRDVVDGLGKSWR